MTTPPLSELAQQLSSPTILTTDSDIINAHSCDESIGATHHGAIGLIRPQSIADVQTTMRFAHTHCIPVVPQGARTGLAGAANAIPGSLLLNMSHMNSILDVDTLNMTATVQPGVINQDLKDTLRPRGLAYPPDPGSVRISTIGGNIATNAGGLCCVKYGVTHDFVRELKIVLPDGTLTRVGHRTAKGVAGLELASLFVGSEGTLGVIVEATLRLVSLPPEPTTALATFPNEILAAQAVIEYMSQGYQPSMMELMDHATIGLLNEFQGFGMDERIGALLLMQSDGPARAEDAQAFEATACINGAEDVMISDNRAESESLVNTRRMIQPSFEHHARKLGGGQMLEDVCVPRSRLADFVRGVGEIRKATGTFISVVAHAGDGNTHPTIFYDAASKASTAAAETAFADIMQLGLDLGGTISGEHGIGMLKNEWLAKELDAGARQLHRQVKEAIDPRGIMNPKKMLGQL